MTDTTINGINLTQLTAAVNAVKANPRAGDYRFFSETVWKNGYNQIYLDYHIKSDASDEQIQALIKSVESTSPVLDIVSRPVPVETRIRKD